MKERPILFSGPMVRAIIEGRKTQTRRVVKPSLIAEADSAGESLGPDGDQDYWSGVCPFGTVGDRLWVRETWNVVPAGRPAPLCGTTEIPKSCPDGWGVMYQASGDRCTKLVGWRPSIHMPRWASRLTLEVTAVRVERLQEISEEDAKAEGVRWTAGATTQSTPRSAFMHLWESIHGHGSWDANPWVFVIEFRKIDG